MNRVASMTLAERRVIIAEGAERLQLNAVIVEKDFWVCWMLSLLFGRAEWREALVFKGGTALSKVFGIIRRFSEDIDLSVMFLDAPLPFEKVFETLSNLEARINQSE